MERIMIFLSFLLFSFITQANESAPAAPTNLQIVDEVKYLKNPTCELTLIDEEENRELHPEIENALVEKGYRVRHVDKDSFKNENMGVGELWAWTFLYYQGERGTGTPLTQSKYWRARFLLDVGAENQFHVNIVKDVDVYDFGIFFASKSAAIKKLINGIPSCEIGD